MNITHGTKPRIEMVADKKRPLWWLVNGEKKRITPKFKLMSKQREGSFTKLETNKGVLVYNVWQNELLYTSDNLDDLCRVRKLDDHLYAIEYGRGDCRTCKLYTEYGALIREFGKVSTLQNGLIAAKKDGKWGFIDEDANDVIPFIYQDVANYNKYGYAVVDYDKQWTVDDSLKTVIDKQGNKLFEPIKCWAIYFTHEDRIVIEKDSRKGVFDITGKEIIPIIYNQIIVIGDFYKGLYKGKWGLLDKDGNILFEPIYDEIIETPDKFVVKDFARKEVTKTREVSRRKEE